jgi:hypothetical protein
MLPIFLLGTLFFSIYYVKRHSVTDAAINVYLPIFLLVPSIYDWRFPHLPNLDFPAAALIPIVIALLVGHWRDWKFRRADLWVAIFFAGDYYSELSNSGAANAAMFFCQGLFTGVMPYILGRLVLEQDGVRERFVRRFVYIAFFVAVVSVWEFRMGNNLFTTVEGLILGTGSTYGALRNGHIRIAGTFFGAEQAGTVFSVAFLLSMWLGILDKSRGNEPKYWGLRRSTILSMGTLGGLLMNMSRGPMVGMVLGYLIARIGNAKKISRAAIISLMLIAVGGTIGYVKAKEYTGGDIGAAKNQDQENAIYRRILLDEYKPYIEKTGLFGYGAVERPVVPGMFSIDNAFLLFQLQQGNLGLWMFVLIGGETLLAACLAARRATQRTDICFALCLCGAVASMLLTLTTLYLGPPLYTLLFLLAGWSQSLRQTQNVGLRVPQPVNARFAFRRVIA